mmetsp:Transcript_130087/g.277905  ORF Transcript_130087/g.277905 Transcript_130087/m.277905 type:complete len:214 (-) Transcript_130087:475-1116(-)
MRAAPLHHGSVSPIPLFHELRRLGQAAPHHPEATRSGRKRRGRRRCKRLRSKGLKEPQRTGRNFCHLRPVQKSPELLPRSLKGVLPPNRIDEACQHRLLPCILVPSKAQGLEPTVGARVEPGPRRELVTAHGAAHVGVPPLVHAVNKLDRIVRAARDLESRLPVLLDRIEWKGFVLLGIARDCVEYARLFAQHPVHDQALPCRALGRDLASRR